MNSFLINLSKVLAHSAVYEANQEFGGVKAVGFDFGGSSNSSNQRFQRKGTTSQNRSTTVPSFLSDILTNNIQSSDVGPTMAANQNNFLNGLLTRDNTQVPGLTQLMSLMSIDPTSYDGKGTLQNLANVDTTGANYAANTEARYQDAVSTGLAQVRSGPDSVRGGQNRVGLAQGEAIDRMALNRTDEIRRAQLQDASLATNAAQIMAAIEAGRRATIAGAQDQWVKQFLGGNEQGIEAARSVDARRGINTGNTALASKIMGVDNQTVNEDLTGKGTQAGSASNWGVNVLGNCCFIFLEGLNGQLPWYVRRGRDVFQTPTRRVGYVRMSRWLVPLMAKHKIVKFAVNLILIKPFLKLGAWFFDDESAKSRWRFYRPYCEAWFKVWDFLGRKEDK